MSSSSQASVYNGFDLCTVYLVEGFRISRKVSYNLSIEATKLDYSVIIVNVANFWCFTRFIVSV